MPEGNPSGYSGATKKKVTQEIQKAGERRFGTPGLELRERQHQAAVDEELKVKGATGAYAGRSLRQIFRVGKGKAEAAALDRAAAKRRVTQNALDRQRAEANRRYARGGKK